MYERFYELHHRPFLTVPDPSFLFWSEGHDLAYTMLRYGVDTRALITVITGEIGAGKTTLLRHLMNEMPEDVTMGLISNM
ncbi:MAG: GTP-binding protein, partial [Pseudomonadota bacterium]